MLCWQRPLSFCQLTSKLDVVTVRRADTADLQVADRTVATPLLTPVQVVVMVVDRPAADAAARTVHVAHVDTTVHADLGVAVHQAVPGKPVIDYDMRQ